MSWSPDIYAKTWEYATLAHQNQSYGGRANGVQINYINHLASVSVEIIKAIELTHNKLNENLAIQCALLHDIIEDTEVSFNELTKTFGEDVANGVLALTKNSKLKSKHVMMTDSLARIIKQPVEIWMVKIADRICNLYHPPFYWDNSKIRTYRDESEIILESLKGANSYLENRLKTKIIEYSTFIK